jgi:uncharacterized protein (TIGR02147 family)
MNSKRLDTPIFTYEDYVEFLDVWLSYAKRFGYTKRKFLEKAGINAKSFLSDILSNRKKIGNDHIQGFIDALGITGDSAKYFSLLVYSKNERDSIEKERILREMATLREKNMSVILHGSPAEYFSSWRYPLIMEYLRCKGYATDASEIRDGLIFNKLKEPEIQNVLKKLINWGMLQYDEFKKAYIPVTNQQTITYEKMPHTVVNDVKRSLIETAVQAMEQLPKEERHISMAIRGQSKEEYDKFCDRIDSIRKEFLQPGDENTKEKRIYTLNIQLYPLMNIDKNDTTGNTR